MFLNSQFLFNCKQLVTVILANLCQREKTFGIAGCSRHGLYKFPAPVASCICRNRERICLVTSAPQGAMGANKANASNFCMDDPSFPSDVRSIPFLQMPPG